MLGRKELGGIFVRFHALELPCLWRRKDIANSVATKDELDENRCNKILIELEEEEPQSCVINWVGHSFASMQWTSYHVWETERYNIANAVATKLLCVRGRLSLAWHCSSRIWAKI